MSGATETIQPEKTQGNKGGRNHIFLPTSVTERLDSLKSEFDATSRPEVIRHLLLEHVEKRLAKDLLVPAQVEALMQDDRPALITGVSGAGKTCTLKRCLEMWPGPALVVDVSNQYVVDASFTEELPKIAMGLSSHDWAAGNRVRFVPASAISSVVECGSVFAQLNLLLKEERRPLEKYLLILEEGQEFVTNKDFNTIVSEGRHYVGKMLIASQKWRSFKDLVGCYLPDPATIPKEASA